MVTVDAWSLQLDFMTLWTARQVCFASNGSSFSSEHLAFSSNVAMARPMARTYSRGKMRLD